MKLSDRRLAPKEFLARGPLPFVLAYVGLVLSPLALARLLGLEHANGQREFAVAAGMVALMLYLSAFFLTGRFGWANGKRGLDLTLKFHRRVVVVALIFALLHVATVIPFGMPDALLYAATPLLLILVTIVIAKSHTRIGMRYERWRLSHGVSAIIIAALLTTHAVIDGRYSVHPVLATYWVIVTVIAILSLFYVHQYVPFKAMKKPYKLVALTKEAHHQWTITVEPISGEAMRFAAGQYAFVSFGTSPFSDRAHPFSFCSSPTDLPRISFTIKESGDFTNSVGNLTIGSNVYLYGPYGHLSLDHHRGPEVSTTGYVLLASGVGFTPMMSLLREMRSRSETKPIKVFYACQEERDILYRDELKQMTSELDLELHLTLSNPSSGWKGESERIDADYLRRNLGAEDHSKNLYFICGSSKFIHGTVKSLEALNTIPVFNIRFEDFSAYA